MSGHICRGCGKRLSARSRPECAECFDEIADLREAAKSMPAMKVAARGAFALVPARPEQIIGSPEWRAAEMARGGK
jgi:hypothetical protein